MTFFFLPSFGAPLWMDGAPSTHLYHHGLALLCMHIGLNQMSICTTNTCHCVVHCTSQSQLHMDGWMVRQNKWSFILVTQFKVCSSQQVPQRIYHQLSVSSSTTVYQDLRQNPSETSAFQKKMFPQRKVVLKPLTLT